MNTHRIETDRLVLRCYKTEDVRMLQRAIQDSLDNLKAWMPWANDEPTPLEAKAALLKTFREDFDSGKDFVFGIFNKSEDQVLGGTGLHPRIGPNAMEIGYWIHSGFLNQGFATEAAAALVKVGFEYQQLERIEIHCDPANIRSRKIPEKLKFELAAILKENKEMPGQGLRDTLVWALTRENYQNSPCSKIQLTAFDKSGTAINPIV